MDDDTVPRALARDPDTTELSSRDRAMVDYVLKLTRTPTQVDAADVETLRAQGFSDRGILDICQVAAYYAYVNRLADGLGVELEERWTDEMMVLTRAEFEAGREEG